MSKPVILIIDDDKEMTAAFSLRLKDDFEVFGASNGWKGLTLLDKLRPAVILLDLNISAMNGLEILRKIRERSGAVNVVIVSKSTRQDWTIECANLNIQGYFQKPCHPIKLITKLKNLTSLRPKGSLKNNFGQIWCTITIRIGQNVA